MLQRYRTLPKRAFPNGYPEWNEAYWRIFKLNKDSPVRFVQNDSFMRRAYYPSSIFAVFHRNIAAPGSDALVSRPNYFSTVD